MDPSSVLGLMAGEDCLVVGLGQSATRAPAHIYQSRWTIGCNRSVNFCAPDFAVCVEPDGDQDVWTYVERASPFLTFTHTNNRPRGLARARAVEFRSKHAIQDLLGREDIDMNVGMSTWYATAVAIALGFERIGLIGVDLIDRRFNGAGFFQAANNGLGTLAKIASDRGQTVVNLSWKSKVTTLGRMDLDWIRFKGRVAEVTAWE